MKTRVINVAAAKARLSQLVEDVASGEEIVIARAGKPRARLVPLKASAKHKRTPGKNVGGFVSKRGFDAPLTAREQRDFEGSD